MKNSVLTKVVHATVGHVTNDDEVLLHEHDDCIAINDDMTNSE
jgi:hypothetical protein